MIGHVIIVEGNISAGKSTLCRTLASRLNMALFLEPVGSNPYLEKFYADPKTYALPLQVWILKQRFLSYVNALKLLTSTSLPGVILDRSVFSDDVFAVKNLEDGNISQAGYDYYKGLRSQMLASLPPPSAVCYLDASPEECRRRVHELRKRECEVSRPAKNHSRKKTSAASSLLARRALPFLPYARR
jgi:NADH dehydrogenase (ubiquinone) 1 alpha subcomplex subunit 10